MRCFSRRRWLTEVTSLRNGLKHAGRTFFSQLDPRIVASAGGIPLVVDGKIIGAIGVSGGASGLMDLGPAQAGVDALK